MEPRKVASLLEDDALSLSLSLSGRDGVSLPLFRPQSPAPSGRSLLRRSIQSNRSSISASSSSSSSSSSCSASPDPAVSASCVTRETFKDDCGTHRFVVWAAVKRNTSERMTAHERLECPLLRCTLRFPDHESMLRHLVACDHLSSCEYWCYDHMRIERFDDSRCKKCLGHASKRRKMLSMARHFFTTIGHTKGRSIAGDSFPPSPSLLSTSLSDLGCDCIGRNGTSHHHTHRDGDRSRRNSGFHRAGGQSGAFPTSSSAASSSTSPFYPSSFPFFGPPPQDCEAINGSNHAELPTSEIPVEIDSKELVEIPRPSLFEPVSVGPTVSGSSDLASASLTVSLSVAETQPSSVNPQDLLVSELESLSWEPSGATMPSISAVIDRSDISASFPSFMDVQQSNGIAYPGVASVSRPFLQLDTQGHDDALHHMSCGGQPPFQRATRPSATPAPRSKNLSPSSSVRSTTSTTSTTSTMSDMSDMSAMSSMSAASYMSAATTVSVFSNTDSLVSPISDSSRSSNQWSTGLETCQTSPMITDLFADDIFAGTEDTVGTGACEDLLFDFDVALPAEPTSPVLGEPCTAAIAPASLEADTGISIADSVSDRSETKATVTSAWYLLLTHIATSATKLRSVDSTSNALAALLLRTAPEHIAKTGMQAVQAALVSGDETMSPSTTLCFLHTVYAFSLITYGPKATPRSDELFTQALAYSRNFACPDRDNYLQIVSVIWQPSNMSSTALSRRIKSPLSHLRRIVPAQVAELALDNPVIATVKAFLDDLEVSAIIGSVPPSFEVQNSSLLKKHVKHRGGEHYSADFVSSTNAVLKTLLQEFHNEVSIASDFNKICQRVATGAVSSVRRFELELHRAAKAALGCSSTFFDIFIPRARRLCDHIYASHESAGNQRPAYYEENTFLILAIFDGMKNSRGWSALPTDDSSSGVLSLAATAKLNEDMQPLPPSVDISEEDMQLVSTEPSAKAAATGTSTATECSATSAMKVESTVSEERAPAETPVGQKVEVECLDCCEICGYRPKGAPQWFRGSMHKHMKTKHSGEVMYKCPYPNCNSQYRNRPDNLQQHQKEKHHLVGSETVTKKSRRQNQIQQEESTSEQWSADGAGATRRPSKRKKMSD